MTLAVPGCWKVTYATEREAREKLRVHRPRRGKGAPQRTYQCTRCGLWHLTSDPRTKGR